MNKTINLNEILRKFAVEAVASPYGNGHINDTYCVESHRYILQRINIAIFKDPEQLMDNIEQVTAFLRRKIVERGGNPKRETLIVIKTVDGKNCYRCDEDNVFRMYLFVENTKSIEESKTAEDLYAAGVGFGRFQKMLSDYPAGTLHESIKDFHHTPKRVEALKEAIREDKPGRAAGVQAEISFALEQAVWADTVIKGIEEGGFPYV